jgi:hypothetical protein
MAGINVWVACTLSGGVVDMCLGWTVGGGIGVGIISWHDTSCVGGFNGGILDGMMVGGALGLLLLATTVSSSSSLLERMWNVFLLRVWR